MDLRHTVTTHYTPTDEEARECYSAGRPGWETGTPAEFDRFIARVKRDAAREALDGLVDWSRAEYDRARHESRTGGMVLELHVQQTVSSYSRAYYPEETP